MKTNHWAAASAVIFLALTISPVRAQENLNELQKRFDEVKKFVDDPLTDEAGIRKALRELEKLNELSNDLIQDESDASKPALDLAGNVAETLKGVQSRLPADLRRRGEPRPGFPVPKFETRALLADHAAGLHEAQAALARHLRKGGESNGREGIQLLFRVSKSQESLAWEAGWPFTKSEAEEVRRAGRLTDEVYANRLKRGIERVNEQIASEIDANGRDRERSFIIHQSVTGEGQKQLASHLEKLRQVGGLPRGLAKDFNEEEAEVLKGAKR